jgi:hypothetical protein
MIESNYIYSVGKYCSDCGAVLLNHCPNCNRFLQPVDRFAKPAPFCLECGLPLPWASRQEIVFHVQNQLDNSDLAEGDRRALHDELNDLLQAPDTQEAQKRQVNVLVKLRQGAPLAWRTIAPIIDPLITAWMKAQMGL